jgi:hypothetical protein
MSHDGFTVELNPEQRRILISILEQCHCNQQLILSYVGKCKKKSCAKFNK